MCVCVGVLALFCRAPLALAPLHAQPGRPASQYQLEYRTPRINCTAARSPILTFSFRFYFISICANHHSQPALFPILILILIGLVSFHYKKVRLFFLIFSFKLNLNNSHFLSFVTKTTFEIQSRVNEKEKGNERLVVSS